MNLPNALSNEFTHGMKAIEANETFKGASRFASGKGRHGDFTNI